MPNHVTNIISLKGDEQKIKEILKAIQNDEYGLGSIDFNKIILMPKSLNIEAGSRTDRGLKAYCEFVDNFGLSAKEALERLKNISSESEQAFLRQHRDIKSDEWELGKTAFQNAQKYGSTTWYDWAVKHWGTKWGAYGYEFRTNLGESDNLWFQTAWTAPHPILEKLTELYPEVTFEHKWADEDIGVNCGRRVYFGGEMIDEYIPDYGVRSIDFAAEVMEVDAAEYGLVLNKTGTEYISVENDEYERIELLGNPALFSNERLTDKDIPAGLYRYDLRHSDDGDRLCAVEPNVAVNHGGSVIIKEPIDFGKDGYISFTDDTSPNFLGEDLTLGQYMRGEFERSEAQSEDGGMQL